MKKFYVLEKIEGFGGLSKEEKEVPETFDDLCYLCKKLKSSQVTFLLGEIVIKIKEGIQLNLTRHGNVWYEYKKDGISHIDILFQDRTPSEMWDLVNICVGSKEKRISELEDKKFELFRQGTSNWCVGNRSLAEEQFAEACKINEEIKRLKEE